MKKRLNEHRGEVKKRNENMKKEKGKRTRQSEKEIKI